MPVIPGVDVNNEEQLQHGVQRNEGNERENYSLRKFGLGVVFYLMGCSMIKKTGEVGVFSALLLALASYFIFKERNLFNGGVFFTPHRRIIRPGEAYIETILPPRPREPEFRMMAEVHAEAIFVNQNHPTQQLPTCNIL